MDEALDMAQEAIRLKCSKWDELLPTDWMIEGAEVLRRLRHHQCWVCGDAAHQANDCNPGGRIVITGSNAEEIGHRALHEQPSFKDFNLDEGGKLCTFKERMEQHERLCWVHCPYQCDYHLKKREQTRDNEGDCYHTHLWHNECQVPDCHVHGLQQRQAHEELCWIDCTESCQFHKKQRRDARKVGDYYHNTITARQCTAKNCRIHRRKTPKVTMAFVHT